jgi:hypothetical protein
MKNKVYILDNTSETDYSNIDADNIVLLVDNSISISGLVSDTGTPAITSNGSTPSLNSGITASEIRSLIGAGTSSNDTTYTPGAGLDLTGLVFSHEDTSSQGSSNNSGRTYIQDIVLDDFGHITGITTATETVTNTNTTYTAGNGLDLSGTVFSHTDTSSQASINNSNGVVIQDVTLDTFGHVSGLNSVDLDGRYAPISHSLDSHNNVTITSNTNGEILKWNGSAWINNTLAQAGIQPVGNYDNYVSWNLKSNGFQRKGIFSDDSIDLVEGDGIGISYSAGGVINIASTFSESVLGLDYNNSSGVLSTTEGYGISTLTKQSQWDTSYNDGITSLAVTGTNTKTITLTQRDGSTISTTWTDLDSPPDGDEYVDALSFGNTTGILTAGRTGSLPDITTSLDGRYSLLDHVHENLTPGAGLSGDIYNGTVVRTFAVIYGTTANTATEGDDFRLSDARTPLGHSLDSHDNVIITSNTNGEILKWNGSAWINNTLVQAGIQPAGDYALDNNVVKKTGETTQSIEGKVGIGTTNPKSKLDVDGGIKVSDDTDAPSLDKVGTMRYRKDGSNTYCEMCMQTNDNTYAWITIIQNNWTSLTV